MVIALLLIAGQSKRFWPLTEKPLWPIAGKTLVEHQVDRLKAGGVKQIILVGSRHNLTAAKTISPGLKTIEQENLSLGMRGALLSALPYCKDEPVLIVGGNDVIEPRAYKDLLTAMKKPDVDGAILAAKVEHYFPGGYLTIKDSRVTSIVEKPGADNEPSDLVNIVAHVHRSPSALLKVLKEINATQDDGYEQALDALFKTHIYHAVRYFGAWQPVKYPWHLLPLTSLLLKGMKARRHPTASVHRSAVLIGPVILSKGVKVMPHATIVGPCYIGEGTIIANSALVRESSVGDHCVIGYSTEVARSVLSHDIWTHSNYIGDSVIGANVSFGSGTVTGNLRLDEAEISSRVGDEMIPTGQIKFGAVIGEGSRLGIHVSLSPGIKIGRGSFINSASLVPADIPDHSFVKMKPAGIEVRANKQAAPGAGKREKFRTNMN